MKRYYTLWLNRITQLMRSVSVLLWRKGVTVRALVELVVLHAGLAAGAHHLI